MFDQLFKFHNVRELGPQRRTSIYANLKRLASSSLKKRSVADEYDSIWFNKNIDNFFEWVKGAELVELDKCNTDEDPVRPELDNVFRKSYYRCGCIYIINGL